jgi:hypothetical protein
LFGSCAVDTVLLLLLMILLLLLLPGMGTGGILLAKGVALALMVRGDVPPEEGRGRTSRLKMEDDCCCEE